MVRVSDRGLDWLNYRKRKDRVKPKSYLEMAKEKAIVASKNDPFSVHIYASICTIEVCR